MGSSMTSHRPLPSLDFQRITFTPCIRPPLPRSAHLWHRDTLASTCLGCNRMRVFDGDEAVQAIRDGRARAFRQALRLSLRDAGALIGVDRMTCWNWEAARRTPHTAIAKAYLQAQL